ncbi:hypothetical protein ACJIZ3_011764 [Penstemon smallii]|uniref:Bifunctional inhibitor/plant lipid transfer protein/seed storage helical domain-containing protein n=1 Tax=Penstemon smallii TaxID=265156 RepID=A0ABD3ULA5_9LAMI
MLAMKMEIISLLIGIVAIGLWIQAMAQSDCQNTIAGLSPCYNYIADSGSTPSPQCCNHLKTVVQTRPTCLCELLNQDDLNQTRALGLPQACNVQTPSASRCHSKN